MAKRMNKILCVTAVAILLTMTCIAVPLNENGDTIIETEDSDAIAPVVILAIVIMMAVIAAETYVIITDTDDPGADTTAALREAAANNVISQLSNALKHDKAYAQDEPYLIGFTTSYFQRMAEVAAADLWSADSDMDFDTILEDSNALSEYATLMLNRMNIVNSIFEAFESKASSWDSSSTYDSMSVSLTFGSQEIVSDGDTLVEYCLGTTASGSNNRVYLYDGGDENDGFLYSTSASTVTNTETGTSYSLNAGYNSLANVPSGIYTLQNGVTYMGSMMQTYSSGYSSVYPATVFTGGSETAYIIETSDDGDISAIYNGTTYSNIASLTYKISYNGTYQSVDLIQGLDVIKVLNDASNLIFSDTINAASAAWSIFDSLGEASVFVSPSSLIPNLENMDFTSDQISLIYISALQQISELYGDGSTTVTADDIMISEDSLDLICYGTIYSDSTMTTATASDVYFTPMCYLRDQAVVIGNTAWMQPGLAMTWTKNEDGTYKAAGLVVLESGNYLSISSMVYRGTSYSNLGEGVTLRVMSLPDIDGYEATTPPDPEPTPSSTDWLLIGLIIVGIIGCIIAIFTDFKVAGIIIIAACVIIYGIVYWLPSLSIWDFLSIIKGGA